MLASLLLRSRGEKVSIHRETSSFSALPKAMALLAVGMFGEQCSAVWPGYGLAGWLVGEYYHARTEGSGLDQLQHLLLAPVSKETLSAAQHHRKDH